MISEKMGYGKDEQAFLLAYGGTHKRVQAVIRDMEREDEWKFVRLYSRKGDFSYFGVPSKGYWIDLDKRGVYSSEAELLSAILS